MGGFVPKPRYTAAGGLILGGAEAPAFAGEPTADPLAAMLKARESRYGDFERRAGITRAIKGALMRGESWKAMPAYQKEALDMIAEKMSRIVNGDPAYRDSWDDIIGYTRLVCDRLPVDLPPDDPCPAASIVDAALALIAASKAASRFSVPHPTASALGEAVARMELALAEARP